MGTYSSITCYEVKDSITEDFSIEGGISCSVKLEVSAANKDALINDLLANQREWPNLPSWSVKPRAYHAVATPFSSATGAVVGQAYTWDDYQVSVDYTTDPTQDLYSESIEPEAEFIRLDHRLFRWSNGLPLTEGEAPGFLQASLKLKRKYFNAVAVPSAILNPGRVHNASYVSPTLGLTFASETLLLTPEPVDRTVTTAGSAGYNYGVSFSYRPNGWNKYWHAASQSWLRLVLPDGSTYNSYPLADLSALLS